MYFKYQILKKIHLYPLLPISSILLGCILIEYHVIAYECYLSPQSYSTLSLNRNIFVIWEPCRRSLLYPKADFLWHNVPKHEMIARFTSFAQFIFERYSWLLSTFFDPLLKFCYYEIERLSKKKCSNTNWANFVLKWIELMCQGRKICCQKRWSSALTLLLKDTLLSSKRFLSF